MKKILIIALFPLLLVAENILYQISTIDALLNGLYDGFLNLEELQERGDFGIGTYHGLDGEMILMDGVFYQVKADGKVYTPDLKMTSPFAAITQFKGDDKILIEKDINFRSFEGKIDKLLPTFNIFYAFKMKGTFQYIKTRSVPKQQKPYPVLAEIASTQPTFEYENITGTILGFRCPSFVKGINVPGYHLHFLSRDKKWGGHLLEFVVDEAILEIDPIHNFQMKLPESKDFYNTNLMDDKSQELKKVEK